MEKRPSATSSALSNGYINFCLQLVVWDFLAGNKTIFKVNSLDGLMAFLAGPPFYSGEKRSCPDIFEWRKYIGAEEMLHGLG